MARLIIEELKFTEGSAATDISTGVEKTIKLGKTGYIESVNLRSPDNIEIVFKNKVIRLKVRDYE